MQYAVTFFNGPGNWPFEFFENEWRCKPCFPIFKLEASGVLLTKPEAN